MAFLNLLLGHLIGDFVLQTNRIAVNKPVYRSWGIIHAVIVTFCMLFFAVPYGLTVVIPVIGAGVIHYIIDNYKADFTERFRLPELPAFLLDQTVHIAIILVISLFAKKTITPLLFDRLHVTAFTIAIFLTFFASILTQYITGVFYPRKGKTLFFRGEKLTGIIMRVLVTLTIFLAVKYSLWFLLLLAFVPVVSIIQVHFCAKHQISYKELNFKLLLDIALSIIGSILLIYTL